MERGCRCGLPDIGNGKVVRAHVDPRIQVGGDPDRIDADKWRPLIMSFRKFYGLGAELQHSRLSEFPEELFKPPQFRKKGNVMP